MEHIKSVFSSGAAPFAIVAVIVAAMALFSLLFGALCLHIATGLLRFDRRSYGRAFRTHFVLIVFSLLVLVATHLTGLTPKHAPELGPGMGRWIVIAILVLVCVVPPFIVKAAYKCSFIAALVVGVLTGIVESALSALLLLGLAIALIAATPANSKTNSHIDLAPHSAPAQVLPETKTASNSEELDGLVGKAFETLQTQADGTLLDVRIVRRENETFVVRHSSGIARIDATDLLRIAEEGTAEEGTGP